MLQITNRRINWDRVLVMAGIIAFWTFVGYCIVSHSHRQREVEYVSNCPRLPSHQQQGPVFT